MIRMRSEHQQHMVFIILIWSHACANKSLIWLLCGSAGLQVARLLPWWCEDEAFWIQGEMSSSQQNNKKPSCLQLSFEMLQGPGWLHCSLCFGDFCSLIMVKYVFFLIEWSILSIGRGCRTRHNSAPLCFSKSKKCNCLCWWGITF